VPTCYASDVTGTNIGKTWSQSAGMWKSKDDVNKGRFFCSVADRGQCSECLCGVRDLVQREKVVANLLVRAAKEWCPIVPREMNTNVGLRHS
jgi:hypothetical protein